MYTVFTVDKENEMTKEIKSEFTANVVLQSVKVFKATVEDNIGRSFHVPAPVRKVVKPAKPTGFFSWLKA